MTTNMTHDRRNDPPFAPPRGGEPDWLAKLQELDPRLAAPHLWTYQTPGMDLYLSIEDARTAGFESEQLRLADEGEEVFFLALIYNEHVTPRVLDVVYRRNATKTGEVPKPYIAHALAAAPACPETVIDVLALTGDRHTRAIIKQRSDASEHARYWISKREGPDAESESADGGTTGVSHHWLFDRSEEAGERYLEHLEDQPTLAQEIYAERMAVDYRFTPDWVLRRIANKTTLLLANRPGAAIAKQPTKKRKPKLRDLAKLTERAKLADHSDVNLLIDLGRRVAKHPNASKDTLATLIDSQEATVVRAAVANPKAPKHRFDRLAKSPLGRVALARHASKGIRKHAKSLMERGDEAVLLALARNTFVWQDDLAALAQSPNLEIQRSVASNPAAAEETLVSLLGHVDATVRASAARNPSTPWKAIQPYLDRGDIHIISGSVGNPNAPVEHVLHYGTSVRAEDRRLLAAAATTPGQLLAALASDDDPTVRQAVAKNSATPPDSLEHCYRHDPLATVREAIIRNPTCPEYLLREAHGVPSLHVHLASNPALPQDIQRVLASSSGEDVRLRLALNPNAIPEVLESFTPWFITEFRPEAVAAVLNPNYPLKEFESYVDYAMLGKDVGGAMLLALASLRPSAATIGDLFDLYLHQLNDSN